MATVVDSDLESESPNKIPLMIPSLPKPNLLDNSNMFGHTISPTPEELDIMLELMMEDVNLTQDKKVVIRKLPMDRKWLMLVQNLSERYRSGPQEVLQEIQEIQELKTGPNKDLLNNLVVSLRSRPIRWISEFIDNGGLGVLLDNLNELEETERLCYLT